MASIHSRSTGKPIKVKNKADHVHKGILNAVHTDYIIIHIDDSYAHMKFLKADLKEIDAEEYVPEVDVNPPENEG